MTAVNDCSISWDPADQDPEFVHAYLVDSYWAAGIERERVQRSMEHSLCATALAEGEAVGFLRVVTDRATYAWIADVFVLEPWRRKGIASQLLESALAHPDLQGLRRMVLSTKDAHELYERHGFQVEPRPERCMRRMPRDAE